ncbi:hypothetical protein D9M71_629290 [compost metagenome]
MQVAGIVGEFVVGNRSLVGPRRVIVVVVFLVFGIEPARATDPRAVFAVANVQFREYIQAIGDQALVEVAVAIVLVQRHRAAAELAALVLQAPGRAVLKRVVPTQTKVRVVGLHFKRLGTRKTADQGSGERQSERRTPRCGDGANSHRTNPLLLFLLAIFLCHHGRTRRPGVDAIDLPR